MYVSVFLGVQTVSEIVYYCFKCFGILAKAVLTLNETKRENILSISGDMCGFYSVSWQTEGDTMQIHQ